MRDAFAEEAGDVLVVEIEPGPAAGGGEAEAGRQRDGGGPQRGEDVPWGGDGKEDGGARDQVEAGEEAELAGEGEVEEDEADGEDEADEAFGEDVEGHDGGEGEAGEESGGLVAKNPRFAEGADDGAPGLLRSESTGCDRGR